MTKIKTNWCPKCHPERPFSQKEGTYFCLPCHHKPIPNSRRGFVAVEMGFSDRGPNYMDKSLWGNWDDAYGGDQSYEEDGIIQSNLGWEE